MNKRQYEHTCERIFQALEKRRAPRKTSCALSSKQSLNLGVAAVMLPAMTIGALAGSLVQIGNAPSVIFSLLGSVAFGACAFGLLLAEEKRKEALWNYDKARVITVMSAGDFALRLIGKGVNIRADAARDIARWSEEYPRIREICIKWGASNKDMTLNRHDYHVLKRAIRPLALAKEALNVSADENRRVDEELSKNGLMEHIKATRDHDQLNQDTHQASASAKPRRV